MTSSELVTLLRPFSASTATERELQDAIEEKLSSVDASFVREHSFGPKNRIDFFFPDSGVGLEIKIKGTLASVTRQLFRYAEQEEVTELVLCTTLRRHRRLPSTLAGKPLDLVCLSVI